MAMTKARHLYKDWTEEDFLTASYCGNCGLPLLKQPDAAGIVRPECPICDMPFLELNFQIIDNLTLEIQRLSGRPIIQTISEVKE